MDLDYSFDPETFLKLRELFRVPEDNDFTPPAVPFTTEKSDQIKNLFSRKLRGFEKADHILQLENNDIDPSKRRHIEVFSRKTTEKFKYTLFPVNGMSIRVVTPNENFRARLNKIKKLLEEAEKQNSQKIELVSKNFSYLFLNGLVVNWTDFSTQEQLDILNIIERVDIGVLESKICLTNEVA